MKKIPLHDKVLEDAVAELGITHLPLEEQREILGSFGALALQAATVAVLDAIPAEKRDTFMSLSEGDTGALTDFLSAEVPDYEKIASAAVAEEVRRFKEFQKTGAA